MGRERILKQGPFDSLGHRAPRLLLSPRVAAKNKWARIEALLRNRVFTEKYRRAGHGDEARSDQRSRVHGGGNSHGRKRPASTAKALRHRLTGRSALLSAPRTALDPPIFAGVMAELGASTIGRGSRINLREGVAIGFLLFYPLCFQVGVAGRQSDGLTDQSALVPG